MLARQKKRVEVRDGTIRSFEQKTVLEQQVATGGGAGAGVLSFVSSWRSLGESNPSFKNENLAS